MMITRPIIPDIYKSFPLFLNEKKYKLSNFAPNGKIVDKIHYLLIAR